MLLGQSGSQTVNDSEIIACIIGYETQKHPRACNTPAPPYLDSRLTFIDVRNRRFAKMISSIVQIGKRAILLMLFKYLGTFPTILMFVTMVKIVGWCKTFIFTEMQQKV